jgi:uncharacterized protein YndB with AHSA1/START domain
MKETAMAQTLDAATPDAARQPTRLTVFRVFQARRETVFNAWSSADHVKRWFSPEHCTVADATVQMQVGGAFDVCMLLPSGEKHWVRGRFLEVVRHTRLVIDMHVTDGDEKPLFRAHTEVTFADAPGGTRMDVVQTYTFIDASRAAPMVAGATEGWHTTLDRLEKELVSMQQSVAATGNRSVVHGTFHLERTYEAPAARVWQALTDATAKQAWFSGPPGRWELLERHMDVRVGGTERLKGRWDSGMVSTFDAAYHDVIPNERLVYSYVMHLDARKISVSLATMQLRAENEKTVLRVTEQGAFLDGYDDAGSRERGTGQLLDALGASLRD